MGHRRERQDAMPRGLYRRLAADGVLLGTLRDAVDGCWPILPRVTRWSDATEDIAAFRKLVADGPLSIVPECRALASVSIGQATVLSDDQGGVRRQAFRRNGYRCRTCGRAGRLEADHVVPQRRDPGQDVYALAGIHTLCRSCHLEKTARENRSRGRTPSQLEWDALIRELISVDI